MPGLDPGPDAGGGEDWTDLAVPGKRGDKGAENQDRDPVGQQGRIYSKDLVLLYSRGAGGQRAQGRRDSSDLLVLGAPGLHSGAGHGMGVFRCQGQIQDPGQASPMLTL